MLKREKYKCSYKACGTRIAGSFKENSVTHYRCLNHLKLAANSLNKKDEYPSYFVNDNELGVWHCSIANCYLFAWGLAITPTTNAWSHMCSSHFKASHLSYSGGHQPHGMTFFFKLEKDSDNQNADSRTINKDIKFPKELRWTRSEYPEWEVFVKGIHYPTCFEANIKSNIAFIYLKDSSGAIVGEEKVEGKVEIYKCGNTKHVHI